MNSREETTAVLNCLRTIEKQNRIIKDLKSGIQAEKTRHLKEISKYKIFKFSSRANAAVSAASKRRLRQKIKSVFKEINNDLNKIGLRIGGCLNIVENNPNSGISDFDIKFNQNISENTLDDEKSLYFKDVACIPDSRYHLFRKGMKLQDRTSALHTIKKLRRKKEAAMGIKPLSTGYYRDPVKMIKERVANYLKSLTQGEGLDLVRIKLGCDGTRVSRNVQLVNFVFSMINERVKAASVNGCYRVGIFRTEKEDYESTSKWLPVIWNQIKELKKVVYDRIEQKVLEQSEFDSIAGERFPNRFVHLDIDYAFCNDMKMNLIVLGLKAANSRWPCMQCTVHKNNLDERGDFSK